MPPVSFRRGPSPNAKFKLNLNHLSFVVEMCAELLLLLRTTVAASNGSRENPRLCFQKSGGHAQTQRFFLVD